MTWAGQPAIVLVEDNPRDAELTMRALRKRNIANEIVWLKDGAEALEAIFGKEGAAAQAAVVRPRVVLLDLKLPKVDGLEVLRALKSNAATQAIPVVILTSSREEADQIRSYQLGVNSYIVKPVDFDKFSNAVAQLGMYWLLLNETSYAREETSR